MTTSLNLQLCRHCRTPLGQNDRSPSAQAGFCCQGCEVVYQLLNEQGLHQYYALRDATSEACPIPVQGPVNEDFSYLDDPEVWAAVGRQKNRGREVDGARGTRPRLRFYVENLHCASCLWILDRVPQLCPDAASVEVRMNDRTIEIELREGGSFAKVASTLSRIGYRPHLIREEKELDQHSRREFHRELVRLGAAGAATGNIMLLAVSLYAGASGELAQNFRYLMAAFALPVMTYCAWPFYQNAWRDLRVRRISLDVPIVFAILVGIGMSISGLVRGEETLYFDSLSMLVFLLLSSRAFLSRIQRHFFQSQGMGEFLFAITVKRLRPGAGQPEAVSALSLKPGDQILMEGARTIPADGFVRSGFAMIHAASLTGEAEPFRVCPGDWVEAGTECVEGEWILEAIAVGEQTRMARILKEAERAVERKTELGHSRVAQAFMIVVVAAMLVLVVAFLLAGDWRTGVERALVLAIVTCPCVFGMAIPLAESLAIRRAAREGILLKSAESLLRLAKIENVFFDKTGTLTTGEFQIEDGPIFENQPDDLRAAVALQARGRHPVARALRRHLIKQGIVADLQVEGFAELPRGGVRGIVQGAVYEMRPDSEGVQVHGNGSRSGLRILLSKDDRIVREFVLRDQLRDEAKEVIDDLQRRGMSCSILSGDQRHIVADCAKALGLADEKALARLQPEEKADEIRRVQKTPASGINSNGLNSVQAMMVGDGVNDALAMAEASVGVAVHGSLEASLRTSDVYLLRPQLDLVLKAIDLAKLNRQVIRNDLLLSASYNVMAGGLAASGWMSPLLAAILMPLSSLTVLTASLWGSERKI